VIKAEENLYEKHKASTKSIIHVTNRYINPWLELRKT